MKAIFITAIIVVVILAIGVPVIYYAVNSGDSGVSTTIPTGQVVGTVNNVKKVVDTPTVDTAADEEDDISAKEMLAQIQSGDTAAVPTVPSEKTGFSLNYLIEQRKKQTEEKCQPLIDAAQKDLDDAEAELALKREAYEDAREDMDTAMDSEDEDEIDAASDKLEAAQKAYDAALTAKLDASSALVDARINCIS
jgi:hypothetical protein